MINYITYVILSFLILIFFSKISYKLNLLDIPNKRKKHHVPTPFTGGLAISFVYIAGILLFDVKSDELNLILSISFLITIVGFIDDKYELNIGSKLSLQIIPIIYLIIIKDLNLIQIGYYDYFNLDLNSFSVPFTILSVIFLINSCNYFDGLDGTLSFTSISILAILYFLIPDEDIKKFLIVILIPLLIFLCFNFSILKLPKLFLGDSGSLLIGFIIAFTLIYISNERILHPILLAWSMVIFVYEFISINIVRLINKKSIFIANRDHLHHIIFDKTGSVFLTNFLIVSLNIFLFIIGYISFKFNPILSLFLFIIIFMVFLTFRKKFYKKNIN
jgi:UDP-GlcNAc:undecaprenyl-phosphate/decaprenyl-phosphate GlcNAc-1-phosphate transferase